MVRRATPSRRKRWLSDAQGDADAVLELEQLPPTADVPVDLLPASWEQIQANLGLDLLVGAHTCLHRCLPALAEQELHWELGHSARMIGERLGTFATSVAYPYGAWDDRVRNAALAAGYEACLTLDRRLVRPGNADVSALPRINIPGTIPDAAFEAWVSGLLPPNRQHA